MKLMFEECSALKELNINNFNTNNVTNMKGIFFKCESLKKLNLNNFNTYKVKDMGEMFAKCTSLEELNIDNFYFNDETILEYMFSDLSEDLKNELRKRFNSYRYNSAFGNLNYYY